MFCARCGKEAAADGNYCTHCGAPLTRSGEQATEPNAGQPRTEGARQSELDKLAGTVNDGLDFVVKLFVWAFVFGGVVTLLTLIGLGDYAFIGAIVICIAGWMWLHGKKSESTPEQ